MGFKLIYAVEVFGDLQIWPGIIRSNPVLVPVSLNL